MIDTRAISVRGIYLSTVKLISDEKFDKLIVNKFSRWGQSAHYVHIARANIFFAENPIEYYFCMDFNGNKAPSLVRGAKNA